MQCAAHATPPHPMRPARAGGRLGPGRQAAGGGGSAGVVLFQEVAEPAQPLSVLNT